MHSVARQQLAEIIGEKTLHTVDKERLVESIAAFVASEPNSIDIDSLVRDVMQYRLEHGIVEAVMVTAHEPDVAVKRDVEALLKQHFPHAKKIILNSRIDEAIVGGIKIELPREVLDLSVRSKLNIFKRLVAEENQ